MAKKKGKYADVLPGLPRVQNEDPKFKESVNAVRRMLTEHATQHGVTLTGNYLAERYIAYRKEKDKLEEQIAKYNVILEVLTQMLTDQFEAEGVSRIVLESGESVGIQEEPYTVVKDRTKVRLWAIENGMEDELMIVWQTLNSLVKNALLAGESLPDGVEVFNKSKAVFRT